MVTTYYLPGQVHPADDLITATHLHAARRMRIADIHRLTAMTMPSLVEEIGFVLEDTIGNRIWLRETDTHFHWLARRLGADKLLGASWYTRAEQGEKIAAKVRA